MTEQFTNKKSERGGAGVKFLLVLTVIFLVAHAGWNYIPVAYQAQDFKQELETAVVQGVALPGSQMTPVDTVKTRIRQKAQAEGIPSNYYLDVKQVKGIVQARVIYQKSVPILPFGLYTYNYYFDHTATPTGFLFTE